MNETIIKILTGAFIAFIGALLTGTIVWVIWPYVVPFVFSSFVADGFLIARISWWHAILLSWLCGALFKSN